MNEAVKLRQRGLELSREQIGRIEENFLVDAEQYRSSYMNVINLDTWSSGIAEIKKTFEVMRQTARR